MLRNEIIAQLSPYFKVKELVCPHVYQKWGDKSWQFLDTDALQVLLIVRRDIIGKPMVINNGSYTQRGLRCNRCQIVKSKLTPYLSAHVLGKAWDFTVVGMAAEDARKMIESKAVLLPCNIRLEKDVTWVHIDVLPQYGINDKVYKFKG